MSESKENIQGEPFHILLVEDNMDHAELVRRSFVEHMVANKITHLTDGQAALDYLFRRGDYAEESTSPRPDIILLDLRIPKVDGLEVLSEIKESEELRSIPVIVLTTSKLETDIDQAYSKYVNSYLVKPIAFDNFTTLMKDLGFYWMGWNQYPW